VNRMDPYLEFAGTSIMERSFAELEYENKKTTRRELFPEGIEEQIPWHGLVEQIRPYYSVSNSSTTSVIRPWSTCSMRLRACVALTGIRLEKAPGETTIPNFRHLLERHGPGQVLFETVREYLSDQGLMLKQGRKILDARIIAAPTSRKNCSGEGDPGMKQSRKGKQRHLDMKPPIGVDDQTGLVHSLATPSAKVHDRTPADRLLHGEEVRV